MAIKVYPGARQATHQISLSDGVQTFGLRMVSGPSSIQEIPMTPSTVHFSGGGTKFGDWEPGMSHIEQRTWSGGRAQDSFVEDMTRFFDSKMAWTLTPGKIFPVPLWKFGKGYQTAVENMPGDLGWRTLYGDYTYISELVTHDTDWADYDRVLLWVRRVGNPADLTVLMVNDNGGNPTGSEHVSQTVDPDDLNEHEIYLIEVDLSGGSALSGTTSHLRIDGTATDNAANHWEIGVDVDGGAGQYYWAQATWAAADFSLYYRILEAEVNQKWIPFELGGALYAVNNRADATTSKVYINGDRGKATAGASTSLTDSNKSWTADEWIGSWVKIINGTGQGQRRQITDNTDTALTVAAWDVTPDTDSEYVIYHSDKWTDISPSGGDLIDGVIRDVEMANGYAMFAQGPDVNILKMQFSASASPPAHQFDDDGTNRADIIYKMQNATDDLLLYKALVDDCEIKTCATVADWGTNNSYGGAFFVGDDEYPIISIYQHKGFLYAFKADGRYYIKEDDKVERTVGEIEFIKSDNNGQATLSHGMYEYFSWGGYAIQRLYRTGDNHDLTNIGPDRDEGLPGNRKGKCVALAGMPPGVLAGIDAGDDGISSLLVLPVNGFGWHEVFRGWKAGAKMQGMYFQDSYQPRLWMSVGGELVYQDWPRHTFNPLRDDGMEFYPEAHVVSSTIDMGVSRLPKFIKELSAAVKNLAGGIEVHVDYQTNEDVGTDNWIYAGLLQVNPTDEISINEGEVYRIRYRLRLVTDTAGTPPVVEATVLEGFARTPVKYQWNVRCKISSTQRDLSGISRDADPDEFMDWLKDAAVNSKRIFMRSIFEQMDSRYVVVEPPSLVRNFVNNVLGFWGGTVQLTIREV